MMDVKVMDAAPSVEVAGVTVPHNMKPWRVRTNRHPTTDGVRWGWIEGAPGNICWENGKAFDENAAHDMANQHNQWIENQKPLSIKLVEARERYAKAKAKYDVAHEEYKAACDALSNAEHDIDAILARHDTAPPSAPVGVEEIESRLRGRYGPFTAQPGERYVDADIALAVLREALAQQPAAVNEAMVDRACDAYAQIVDDYMGLVRRKAMRAALTAALAAQPGGSDNA